VDPREPVKFHLLQQVARQVPECSSIWLFGCLCRR
jgi:hypothetical protein